MKPYILILLLMFTACDTPTGQVIIDTGETVLDNLEEAGTEALIKADSVVDEIQQKDEEDVLLRDTQIQVASSIAAPINSAGLTPIDSERLIQYEYYITSVDNINTLIRLLDEKIGFEIAELSKTQNAHDEFMRKFNRYSPLIDNYNSVVSASNNFDGSEKSSETLLKETAVLSVELGTIAYSPLHKAIFTSVGTIGAKSGLLQVARVCRTCVSATYGMMYWTGKDTAVELTGDTVDTLLDGGVVQ